MDQASSGTTQCTALTGVTRKTPYPLGGKYQEVLLRFCDFFYSFGL